MGDCRSDYVRILTFGDFDILMNGVSVFKKGRKKYKNLDLLKFFITNKNRKIAPDIIIDLFWSDKDYENPKNALNTQIHRLKKYLIELGLISNDNSENNDYLNIYYLNGFYILTTSSDCTVDVDEFTEKIALADSLKTENPEIAINNYEETLNIYRGQYMEGNIYSEWSINARNKYHRMYVQSAIRLMELLKKQNRFEEIVNLFEYITAVEPYEEGLHIYFLEALKELKEYRYALSHYNYISTKISKEIGVKPSFALQNVYRQILNETDDNQEVDLLFIDKKLTESELLESSIFCDKDYFKFVYNLERKKSQRHGDNSILMMITLPKAPPFNDEHLNKYILILRDILWAILRKTDLITRWNNNQILVLLIETDGQYLQKIINRIETKFKEAVGGNVALNILSKPVTMEKL